MKVKRLFASVALALTLIAPTAVQAQDSDIEISAEAVQYFNPNTRDGMIGLIYHYANIHAHRAYSIYDVETLNYHGYRVARCESVNFTAFIGDYGNSIGPFQWHARGRWWSVPWWIRQTDDRWNFDRNIEAGVWAIANGWGPRDWVHCWRNSW